MKQTSRPHSPAASSQEPQIALQSLIEAITRDFQGLSPQLRQAARHVLAAPREVAIRSMRGFASDAKVPPSTMVRLAKAAGFASYEAFRAVFQAALRSTGSDFVSRAEWLQRLPEGGRASQVVGGMAAAILDNVEQAFRAGDVEALVAAADLLHGARRVHVVGVGGLHPVAAYFHYVARMALPDVRLAAPIMASMIDELADAGARDVVVLMSVSPYAAESVRAAEFAQAHGARLLVLTDDRTSPVAPLASSLLLVPTGTPQFFPSQAAMIALIETVIALVVSRGDHAVLERLERVEQHRREQGIYWRERG